MVLISQMITACAEPIAREISKTVLILNVSLCGREVFIKQRTATRGISDESDSSGEELQICFKIAEFKLSVLVCSYSTFFFSYSLILHIQCCSISSTCSIHKNVGAVFVPHYD